MKKSNSFTNTGKVLLAMAIGSFLWSNTQAQSVNYTYRYNDPYSMRKLKVNLNLTMEGFTFGGGLSGSYALMKYLDLDGALRLGIYSPMLIKENIPSTLPSGYPMYFEGGGSLHFFDKLRPGKGKMHVTLSSGYNTETFINIPVDRRRVYALHGGVMFYTQPVPLGDTVITKDGGKLTTDNSKSFYTNSQSSAVYIGIQSRKVKKVGVTVDGYGNRRNFADNNFFLDAIIGGTHLSDMTVGAKTYDVSNVATSHLGWRFGMQWNQNNVLTRIEFGKKPSVQTEVPFNYFLISFGVTLVGWEKAPASTTSSSKDDGGARSREQNNK